MPGDLHLEEGFAALFAQAGLALHAVVEEAVLPRSQALVPRDTETLADSATITGPTKEGDAITVTLSYGREDDRNPKTGQPSAAYAVDVHERVDVLHPTGQAKYLEVATNEAAPIFGAMIAARM